MLTEIWLNDPIQNGMVTPQSNLDYGQLVNNVDVYSHNYLKFYYYTENVAGEKYYRIYQAKDENHNCIVLLNNSLYLKGFQFTDIMIPIDLNAESSKRGLGLSTGYILKKNGSLLEEDGIFLTKGMDYSTLTLQAYRYELCLTVGQHCFRTISSACEKDKLNTDPYLEALVELAGGFDKFKQEGLIFLPHLFTETAEPNIGQVTFLLPYLYSIQEKIRTEESECNEQLDAAIEYAENIITEADCVKDGTTKEAMEEQIRRGEERIFKEGSPEIIQKIDKKATNLYIPTESHLTYKRPARKQKWNKSSEEAKNRAIAILAEEKAKVKMKERIKAICQRHLQDTNKRHYNASETERIKDALLNDLESKGIITITGKETQNGSHAAMEISANNRSIKVGLVVRNHTEGFRGGTVKTILNGCLEKVLKLFENELARK